MRCLRSSRSIAASAPRLRSLITLSALPLLMVGASPRWVGAQQMTVTQEVEDPYIWLEEVEGEEAMQWVLEQNERTRSELKAHPVYQTLFDSTLEILTSTDRIAYPSIHGDMLYNFWTDAEHPRGIYRRTTWESYLNGSPEWDVVLDMDALVADEGTPWAFRGMTCLLPEERLCMVSLSPGGSDAVEVREFDVEAKYFVDGGFTVPVSKNSVAWVDQNTLLVSHNLDPEYVTSSGYSRAARRWERGTALDAAPIVLEAGTNDMGVFVSTQETAEGPMTVVARLITIFDTDMQLLRNGVLVPVDIPSDAQLAMVGDQLVLKLVSDWEVGGHTFAEGAVVSANLQEYLAGQRNVELVLRPDERSTINGISATKDYLLVNQFTDVQGKLIRYWREGDTWVHEAMDTPPMGSVYPRAMSVHHNRFFFTFDSFTQPTALFLAEEDGSVREVTSLPHQFAADGLVVEQHHATSADGTRVPYFVVRAEDAPMDGTNPTLLYAYGGFQISSTPAYLGLQGKAWVEGGGVYVLANIRGGGEFGPSWWKAALKENRQRAYDDFIAVGEDLVARGITSPDHLGIMGGSNGGLLVGAAMTQRPDLFNAVVVQVPLLDMKRYHKLLAGASWMAEYGNPDIPEEWAYISQYSPYQNVHEGVDYPRPFIFTTTRDDRVHPGHARKMAAKMMSQGHEILYFENVEGGHGSGVTPEQQAESMALSFAYLHLQLKGPARPVSE
jgi:prolyl oligopeptidase